MLPDDCPLRLDEELLEDELLFEFERVLRVIVELLELDEEDELLLRRTVRSEDEDDELPRDEPP